MFIISPAAVKYIEEKGKEITVYVKTRHSGCGWGHLEIFFIPAVRRGRPAPKEMSNYTSSYFGNIDIWKSNDISIAPNILVEIDVKKWWIFNKLIIKGIQKVKGVQNVSCSL